MPPAAQLSPSLIEAHASLDRQVRYNVLLNRLKVSQDYQYFCHLIQENHEWKLRQKKARIKRLNAFLDELDEFVSLLQRNNEFNRSQIINWINIFQSPEELDIQINNILNKSGKFIACYKGYITIALNFISLALNLLTTQHTKIIEGAVASKLSDDMFKIFEGLLTGAKQCHDGEVVLGSMNIFSSVQRLALNLTTLIGNKIVGTVSSGIVPVLGSVTLIVGLLLSCAVEMLQLYRSHDRIKSISKQIELCKDSNEGVKLNQLLIAEYANYDNHKQNLKGLSVTLTCISIVVILSFTVLSGLSFGTVPLATIVLTATALVINSLRMIWLKSKNANQKLKASTQLKTEFTDLSLPESPSQAQGLDESSEHLNNKQLYREANIIDKWNKLIVGMVSDGQNPEGEITFTNGYKVKFLKPLSLSNRFLTSTSITFKQYIDKIFVKFPDKAQAIISSIEEKDYRRFQNALAMRQHPFMENVKKTTVGCKLLRQLTIRPPSQEGMVLGG